MPETPQHKLRRFHLPSPGAGRVVVTAEIPAYANRIVNTEWFFVWTRVESSETLVEWAERRDAMIGDP